MIATRILKQMMIGSLSGGNDVAYGKDADKDTAPGVTQIYYAFDVDKLYYCEVAGAWIEYDEDIVRNKQTFLCPDRPETDYVKFVEIDAEDKMTGGAAQKTYILDVSGERPLGSGATGDSNDAVFKGALSNYAVNDANFIQRGINVGITNRDGGVLGVLDHALGCQGKSGGTVGTINGLTVTAENYGTVSDRLGGIDVVMKNEATIATLEYGIRIRNLNNSVASSVESAILVSDTGANIGFNTGLDLNGATLVNEMVFSNGVKVTVAGDTIVFTNAAGSKTNTLTMT